MDERGIIVYVNPRQCENSRLASEELVGRHHRTLFLQTLERERLLEPYDRLFEAGEPFAITLPSYRRHSDGAPIAFTLRGFRSDGHFILFTSIDLELASQLARYEQLFESANDGIFILSRECKFIAVNDAFAEITGVPREQMLGQTTEIFLPGRFAQSEARLERILKEGRLGPYELEIATPRGRRFISLNGFALFEGGKPLGVMNIARDTTEEHRRAEERETVYQLSHDLARSLDVGEIAHHLFERTRSLLGAGSGLLLLRGRDGALRRVAGYGDDTDWGSLGVFDVLDAAPEWKLAALTIAACDTVAMAGFGDEHWAKVGSARRPPTSVWAVPLTSGSGAEGALLVGHSSRREAGPSDLRVLRLLANESAQAIGRARLTDEVREARDEALEASRLKSAFLANMSHEIRTPLNVILGFSSLIGEHLEHRGDDSQNESLRGLRRAGNRLLDTIRSILDISRIEARAFDVHPEPLALSEVVERQVSDFAPLAAEKGLALRWEGDLCDVVVRFDEYCLSNALTNLLQNAIKFTERGGVTVRVYPSVDGALWIDVHDTGIGIGAEHLPRLFEPFSQEDSGMTRRFEGSGLGLALARSYLVMNGATLSVESEKAVGSRFTIHFPPECVLHTGRAATPGTSEPAVA